jgi:hypothetical protein
MKKNQLCINNMLCFFMKVKNNAHARFPAFGFVDILINDFQVNYSIADL